MDEVSEPHLLKKEKYIFHTLDHDIQLIMNSVLLPQQYDMKENDIKKIIARYDNDLALYYFFKGIEKQEEIIKLQMIDALNPETLFKNYKSYEKNTEHFYEKVENKQKIIYIYILRGSLCRLPFRFVSKWG